MRHRSLVESILVSLGMAFGRYAPATLIQSLAQALREEAERRERAGRREPLATR